MTTESAIWARRMEVDGIVSWADIEDCVATEPMFRLLAFEYGSPAYLRCSRPYDSGDEKRWLAGDCDKDLDWWEHHPDD